MPKYKFLIECTSGAWNYNSDVPENQWGILSKHTTIAALFKANAKAVADIHKRCGPNGHDTNFRITALVDTPLTVDFFCRGYYCGHGKYKPCPSNEEKDVTFVWKAGCLYFTPDKPEGWHSPDMCAACGKKYEETMYGERGF